MALSTNIARFHKEIFPKVRYDEMLEQYRINIGDYILLNLTKRQIRLLEKICQQNNIYIEKIPELLSVEKSTNLFIKLLQLKELSNNSKNPEEQIKLGKLIQDIRNKLFDGHLKLLYIVLYNCIPDLETSNHKEDILQSAYLDLIKHIDSYNPHTYSGSFRRYFRQYTARNIVKHATYIQNNSINSDYNTMLFTRSKNQTEVTMNTENLSKQTRLDEKRIEELIVLEQILNAQSLEELTEKDTMTPDLLDESQEEKIHQSILQELFLLILETLPNELQKEVAIRRYGFNGLEPQKFEEIATDLGIQNRQRVQQLNSDIIEKLGNTIRAKYIKELVEGYSEFSISQIQETQSTHEQNIDYEKLEKFLIVHLPYNELIELITKLDIKYRKVLLSFLELNDNTHINYKNCYQELGIHYNKYLELKQKGLLQLRSLIKDRYVINNPNDEINSVLDYLMYNYLHKVKNKSKKLNP